MGASVCGYWLGITEDQRDSMPGFWNDDRAFGSWMANREDQPDVLAMVRSLGCGAVPRSHCANWSSDRIRVLE